MPPGHVLPKTLPKLDTLIDFIRSCQPFIPDQNEMAVAMNCSRSTIRHYLAVLTRQGRIVVSKSGQVAIMPPKLVRTNKEWQEKMKDPALLAAYEKYRDALEKMHSEHPDWWTQSQ